MNVILPTLAGIPLAAAAVIFIGYKVHRRLPEALALIVTFYLLAAAVALYFFRPFNFMLVYRLGGSSLVLDGLSHLIFLSISMVAFFVTLYAVAYMQDHDAREKFYTLYLLMVAGMVGVVLSADLFNLFIFLELASVSTYALVAFGTRAEEIEAAFRYLVLGTIASVLILFAIGLVYALTGSVAMADINFPPNLEYVKMFAAALFIAGFGMKAAAVPFHFWLPDAHTVAPAPVSATLSGILIKVLGIYSIVRVIYNVIGINLQLSQVLVFLGVLSILVGGLLAFFQKDLKRLLAYSSVSQIGYILLGIGLATPFGILAGLFHLFNHASFKPLLFLNAGAVEHETGTRRIDELGGLNQKMKITSVTSMIGSLAISGMPPFNGFWSKLFVILACIQAGRFWPAMAAIIGSIITLSYFLKLQKSVFLGDLRAGFEKVKESPYLMVSSMVMLALICVLAGVFFQFIVTYLINPAVLAVANGTSYGRMITGGQ